MAEKRVHAKKKREEEHGPENAERWLLTYADMITLLMLFFIVLYAMSSIDKGKYQTLAESLRTAFNGGMIAIPFAKGDVGMSGALKEGMVPPKVVPPSRGKEYMHQRLKSKLESMIAQRKVKVQMTERGVTISLASDVYFASGSAAIVQTALPVLEQISEALTDIGRPIRVEGHTDDSPVAPGQKFASNWELSAQRALNVLQLVESFGMPSNLLSAVAFGDTHPLMKNDTPEGRAYNRRVDIVIEESP